MTSRTWDRYFKSFLDIEGFSAIDRSLNGLQVDNDGAEITKIAFAVDASLETFERALNAQAGMIFVHHGLFWGQVLPVSGNYRRRLQFLLDHNIALYAVHLPLDQDPELGNNAALISLLGAENPEAFGDFRGRKIGYKGTFPLPITVEKAAGKIAFMGRPPLGVYPFGKRENTSCAAISGAGAYDVLEAIDAGIDLYISGEMSHGVYHQVMECGINMIAGGHYSTEVWGVRRVMEKCAGDSGAEVVFIDVPTGL